MHSRKIINFDLDELAARLTNLADGQVQTGKSLAPYTSYKIGGPTALWVAPSTVDGVGRVLEFIEKLGYKFPLLMFFHEFLIIYFYKCFLSSSINQDKRFSPF